MNIKQLTYFSTVAKYQSYSRASKELFISQPTLCSSIHNLEKELGVSLFQVKGRNIVLTDDGNKLWEQTKKILDQYEDFEQRAYAIAHPNKGEVAVAVPYSLSKLALRRPIQEFCEMYPEIRLNFEIAGAARIQRNILEGDWDCGFSMEPIHKDLQNVPILHDKLVLIAPSSYRVQDPRGVTLEELEGERLILLGPESVVFQKLQEQFNGKEIRPNIVMCTPEVEFILEMVKRGAGLSIQSRAMVNSVNVSGINTYPLTGGDFDWNISLIYRNSNLSAPARTFCNFIRRYFGR